MRQHSFILIPTTIEFSAALATRFAAHVRLSTLRGASSSPPCRKPNRDGYITIGVEAFTLIELLFALFLMMCASTLLLIFFVREQQADGVVQNLLMTQTQQRFIGQILHEGLQQSGYRGCHGSVSRGSVIDHGVDATAWPAMDQSLQILSAEEASLIHWLTRTAIAGSSVLWTKQASVKQAALQQAVSAGSRQWVVDQSLIYQPGETVMLADCRHVELFTLIAVEQREGEQYLTVNSPTVYAYPPLIAGVSRLISRLFYIAPTGRYTGAGRPVNALYQQDYAGKAQALVSGVDQMTAYRDQNLIHITIKLWYSKLFVTVALREVGV